MKLVYVKLHINKLTVLLETIENRVAIIGR